MTHGLREWLFFRALRVPTIDIGPGAGVDMYVLGLGLVRPAITTRARLDGI